MTTYTFGTRAQLTEVITSFAWAAFVYLCCAFSSSAFESAGREIVYFDCQPGSRLYVKAMTLYDVSPVLNKHTFDLARLTAEQKTQACQISKSVKATVYMSDGISVYLNKELIGAATSISLAPTRSYSYFITKNMTEGVDVVSYRGEEHTVKTTRSHFNDDIK
jgi:hypothetical protein